MLRQQLDSVGQRLAVLQPEIEAARLAYDQEAEAAVRRIRFYDIYAGSALGALWAGAQDPIDVIASTELLQRRLGDDLEALANLSSDYEQLHAKESSLRRYADLLVPFRNASLAREQRLSQPPPGLVSPFAVEQFDRAQRQGPPGRNGQLTALGDFGQKECQRQRQLARE